MKILGEVNSENKVLLLNWCRKQDLREETKSSYVQGRREKWYRMGSNLQSISMGRAKVFEVNIYK